MVGGAGTSVAPLGTTRSGRRCGCGHWRRSSRGWGCAVAAAGAGGAGRRGGARASRSSLPARRPALTALAVLFVRPIEHLVPIPQVGYLDEGLVMLCAVTLPLRGCRPPTVADVPGPVVVRRLRRLRGAQRAGRCTCRSRSSPPVPSSSQGPAVRVGGRAARLGRAAPGPRGAGRRGADPAVLAAAAVNLAIPGAWEAVLASDTNAVEARSFLPSLIGPFTHPLTSASSWRCRSSRWPRGGRPSARRPFTLVLLVATALGALGDGPARRGRQRRRRLAVAAGEVRSTAVLVALAPASGRGRGARGPADATVARRPTRTTSATAPRGPHRADRRLVQGGRRPLPAGRRLRPVRLGGGGDTTARSTSPAATPTSGAWGGRRRTGGS